MGAMSQWEGTVTAVWEPARSRMHVVIEVAQPGELELGFADVPTEFRPSDIWAYIGKAVNAALSRRARASLVE